MGVMELEEHCKRLGIRSSDLNILVYKLHEQRSGEINEGGFEYQLPFILSHLGQGKLEQAIQEIVEKRGY